MSFNIIFLRAFPLSVCLSLLLASCEVQESDLVSDFNIDDPIAYTKRPVDAMTLSDPRTNAVLTPGGNLFIHDPKDKADSSADVNVTAACTAAVEGVKGAGDVMSINTSYDGKRIVFAMHLGVLEDGNADPNTWDVWEYLLNPQSGENALRMVITGKTCGDAGLVNLVTREGNDLDPAYLPDGRIVFTSDRQKGGKALQIPYGLGDQPSEDEEGREPALNLHVMSSTGKDVKQISYNQSDDRFPSVLHTGEIVFSRWERAGITESRFDLYTVLPDGSEMKLLYGSHSHLSTAFDPAFYKARQMADGRLVAMLMQFPNNFDQDDPVLLNVTSAGGGELVFIDYENYADVNDPRDGKTSAQSAGHVSATAGRGNIRLGFPSSGRYAHPFPVWQPGGKANQLLISYATCKQIELDDSIRPCSLASDPALLQAKPAYGLFFLDTDNQTFTFVIPSEAGMVLTDATIMVDRTALLDTPINAVPLVIQDKAINGMSLEQDLIARNMGAIKIRSVYDTLRLRDIGLASNQLLSPEALPCMNKTTSEPTACDDSDSNIVVDIATLADPALTTSADQRPVRYVRVVGAMPNLLGNGQGFASGIRRYEMRAILGYAPVEPDGSVYVEVPADKPFAIELVSKDGHKFIGQRPRRDNGNTRTFQSHDNWLQVIPGETLECNGCHEGHSGAAALNAGAPTSDPFPNTLASMSPNPLETMAETRIRISCLTDCADRLLDRDMRYTDVWTDPLLANRAADVPFSIEYNDRSAVQPRQGLSANVPIYNIATAGCKIADLTNPTSQGNWASEDGKCRIVIDYERHIQPLWDQQRLVDDGLGVGGMIDRRCTLCHNTVDVMNVPQVPAGAGQLDLTSDGSGTPRAINANTRQGNGNRFVSYEELARRGLVQEIVNGVLDVATTTVTVPVLDENGNPTFDPVTNVAITEDITTDNVLATGPVISPFSARRSYFIKVMTGNSALDAFNGRSLPTPTIDHTVMMTRGELRVVTEWIEMGVQYFNDPGAVP